MSYCTNTVINGGTFAYINSQRPVAQGTITAINQATGQWTVQVPREMLGGMASPTCPWASGGLACPL